MTKSITLTPSQLIGFLTLAILLGMTIMVIYHEYKYDLSISKRFCRNAGYEDFVGISFVGDTSGNIFVDGVLCEKENTRTMVERSRL